MNTSGLLNPFPGNAPAPVSPGQTGFRIPAPVARRSVADVGSASRVINLSSAAQSPVNLEALAGRTSIPDQMNAYAQSKLAITMWSRTMAELFKETGPLFIAVNPGSLLATKMVKEGFGVAGNDIRIGADVLVRAALSSEFESASGKYFDNDVGQFAPPHADALDTQKTEDVMRVIDSVLAARL